MLQEESWETSQQAEGFQISQTQCPISWEWKMFQTMGPESHEH